MGNDLVIGKRAAGPVGGGRISVVGVVGPGGPDSIPSVLVSLLHDTFSIADPTPLTNPLPADLVGQWDVDLDTGNNLAVASNELQIAGAVSNLDPRLSSFVSYSRLAGLSLLGTMTPNAAAIVDTRYGFDSAVSGSIDDTAFQYTVANQLVVRISASDLVVGIGVTDATAYDLCIVARAIGYFFYIKGGTEYPEWTLIWIDSAVATSPLWVGIGGSAISAAALASVQEGHVIILPSPYIPKPLMSDGFGTIPTIADSGSNGLDGTPVRVGLNGSEGSFDGQFSVVQLPAVAMDAAGFDGGLGGCVIQPQVANAEVWASETARRFIRLWGHDDDRLFIRKTSNANEVFYNYVAGGAGKAVIISGVSPTAPFTVGMSWSDAANDDRMIAYFDGAQTGAIQTGVGTWTNDLVAANTIIGAFDNIPSSEQWLGKIPNTIIWLGYEPSAVDMADVDTKLAAETLTVADLNAITPSGGWMWYKFGELYASDGGGHLEGGHGAGVTRLGGTWSNAANKLHNAPLGGDELLTNGDFANWTADDPDGWTIGNELAPGREVSEVGPTEGHLGTGTGAANIFVDNSFVDMKQAILVAGNWYKVIVDVTNSISGGVRVLLGTSALATFATVAVHTTTGVSTGADFLFQRNSIPNDLTIDSGSVQQLALADLLGLYSVGTDNLFVEADLTVLDVTQCGVSLRWDSPTSPANGVKIYVDRAVTDQVVVRKRVAGSPTEVATETITYSAGAPLAVYFVDDDIVVHYAGAHLSTLTSTISDAGITGNVLAGGFSTHLDNTIENLRVWGGNGPNFDKLLVG